MTIPHTLMLTMMASSFLPEPLAVLPFMPLTLKSTTSQPTILPHEPTSFVYCMVKSQQLPLDFSQQQQPNAQRLPRHPRKSPMTSHSRFSNPKSMASIFRQQCASSNALSSILCNLTLNITIAGESYQYIYYYLKLIFPSQSGVLLDIFKPMHDSWQKSGPSIRRIKPFLFIFRHTVFPNLLKFTTYPINVAQKSVYSRLKNFMASSDQKATAQATPYYWTELIALFDRCTAVAYTGSMKVVPKKLGTLFWFGLAVHAGFMPTFNSSIIQVPDDSDNNHGSETEGMKVIASGWPVDAKTYRPLQASSRTHEIEYKERFLEVCNFLHDNICFRLSAINIARYLLLFFPLSVSDKYRAIFIAGLLFFLRVSAINIARYLSLDFCFFL